jgi:hypothetical protein
MKGRHMSDSPGSLKPKTQPALAGGPPRPPKKTARGLDDESPDDARKKLAKLKAWVEQRMKAQK